MDINLNFEKIINSIDFDSKDLLSVMGLSSDDGINVDYGQEEIEKIFIRYFLNGVNISEMKFSKDQQEYLNQIICTNQLYRTKYYPEFDTVSDGYNAFISDILLIKANQEDTEAKSMLLYLFRRVYSTYYNRLKKYDSLNISILTNMIYPEYNEESELEFILENYKIISIILVISKIMNIYVDESCYIIRLFLSALWKEYEKITSNIYLNPNSSKNIVFCTSNTDFVNPAKKVFLTIMRNLFFYSPYALPDETDLFSIYSMTNVILTHMKSANLIEEPINEELTTEYSELMAILIPYAKSYRNSYVYIDWLRSISHSKTNIINESKDTIELNIEIIELKNIIKEMNVKVEKLTNDNKQLKLKKKELSNTINELRKSTTIDKSEELELLQDELYALKKCLFNASSDKNEYNNITVQEMREKIKDKKVIIIGGSPNWFSQLKNEFGENWTFINPDSVSKIGKKTIQSAEIVYFYTKVLSHKLYYAYVKEIKKSGKTIHYLNNTNIKKLTQCIYQDLYF